MCIYVFLILPTDLNQYIFLYWKGGEGAIPTLRSSAGYPRVYLGTATFALEPNCPLPTQDASPQKCTNTATGSSNTCGA